MTEAKNSPDGGFDPRQIEKSLAELRRRVRGSLAIRGLSLVVLTIAGLALLSFSLDRMFRLSMAFRVVALVVYAAALAHVAWHHFLRPVLARLSIAQLSDLVESHFPHLGDGVRSAIDFLRDARVEELAKREDEQLERGVDLSLLLKRRVARRAGVALDAIDTAEIIDTPRVVGALAISVCGLALLGVVGLVFWSTASIWLQRQFLFEALEYPYRTHLEIVDRDRLERGVPRGRAETILVRASKEIPSRVTLRLTYPTGTTRFQMPRLDDGVTFRHELGAVTESFELVAEGGDFETEIVRVPVLERPVVDALRVTVRPPEYTGLAASVVDGDVGEIALPAGSRLELEGRSNKPLAGANLLTEGASHALRIDPSDALRFSGSYSPELGGPASIELVDQEDVPPDRLFQLSTHLIEDRPPNVQARVRGLGPMVTNAARFPLEVKARDDYGVVSLLLAWELSSTENGAAPTGEAALSSEGAALGAPTLEVAPVWELSTLSVEPERRIVVRVGAADNDALGGSKLGFSPALSFLIVTPERLGEELVRREEEQRRILERLIEEEKGVRDEVYRQVDLAWRAEGPLAEDGVKMLLAMARTERSHGRQLLAIRDAIEQILLEMENNRIGEADDLRRLAELILVPLAELGEGVLPEAATRLGAVRDAPSAIERVRLGAELGLFLEAKLERLELVLERMARLEGFTEIVKRLRAIIRTQKESAELARELYQRAVEDIFDE